MKNIKNAIIWILTVLILILGMSTCTYYQKYNDERTNCIQANDSAFTYKNKYGEEYAAKNTYIMKANQLQKYNDSLYQEYKSLKDNPIVITKIKTVTRIDTVYAHTDSIFINDSTVVWAWSANDSTFYKVSGKSFIKYDYTNPMTMIEQIAIDAGITLDVIDNGQQLSVIAKSNNPYLNIGLIQSVVIDPVNSPTIKRMVKKKKYGIGPFVGVGLNDNLMPGGNGLFGIGVTVGVGFTYDFFQW